jgi:hypothetical protein
MLFTLEIQHSYTRKALITKMIWKKTTMKRMPCIREVGPYNIYLMFLWQVEFWLAKNLLLKLQGSRAVYSQ